MRVTKINEYSKNKKTKKSNNKIRVVELFAGVGGFRLGLERTSKKFDTVWANQWEPNRVKQWAFDCYIQRFGESENHVNEDISKVIDDVPEHDLLVGGFPCQDYSVARTNARGIEGKKGVLWWNILEVIQKRHPKFILLENVDRLIKSPSKQRGRDFGIMLRTLHDEGYDVEWRVINAAEYGHVQRRRRVFIFAYKKELANVINGNTNQDQVILKEGFFIKKFPIKGITDLKKQTKVSVVENYADLVEVSDKFRAMFYNSGSMINGEIVSAELEPKIVKGMTLNDVIEKDGVNEKYFVNGSYDKFAYLKGNKKIPRVKPNGEPYIYSEGAMAFPDSMDRPARTMITSEGSINRSTHVILDPKTEEPRLITPLEAERINGFDDNWTNTGMPEKFRYFCMGNALVVPLIEKMGKQILTIWKADVNE